MNIQKVFVVVMVMVASVVAGCSKEPKGNPEKEVKGKPEAKQVAEQPEVEQAVEQPEAKQAAEQPEVEQAAEQAAGQSEAEQAAGQVAQEWLALVDDGKNAESWEQGTEFFKAAVSQEKWVQTLKAVRGPLGALISRKIISTQYMSSVPGGPEGACVIVQFSSSFANKKSAIETVTPMKGKDNTWRVSGYYIK